MVSHASPVAAYSTATLFESGASMISSMIKPISSQWTVAGRVLTVELAPGHNIWIHRAVYEARPGDVLVVATGARGYDYGYWGDILTSAARQRGIAGLVIDGCVRDGRELVEAGFPVFARGLCVRGTGKDADLGGGIGHEITIGGCSVRSGDFVVGDQDGVVVIESGALDEVAAAAGRRIAAEMTIIERIAAGESTLALYKLS